MAKDESNFPPEERTLQEPLSVTGMFRRISGTDEEAAATHSPAGKEPEHANSGRTKPVLETSADLAGSQEPGDFTRLFERVLPGSTKAPAGAGYPPESAAGGNTGESTRVFLSALAQDSEGPSRPGNAGKTMQQRGFSSPGKSESAAVEGSVTQLFRAPAGISVPQPALTELGPDRRSAAGNEPEPHSEGFFRPAEAAPSPPAPGITHLLESLAKRDPSRIDPVSLNPHFSPGEPAGNDGVTRFIEKLGEESRHLPGSAAQHDPLRAKSDPGEYTRMVARIDEKPIAASPAEPAVVKAAPTRGAMPAAGRPAPAIQPTPPKTILPPAAPSQSKTKLETLAPVLLAVNTGLLMIVLLLLILLLRTH